MIDRERVGQFARDGYTVIRGLAPRVDVESWRPQLQRVVERVSRTAGRQGRIDDYSKLFMQVTNVWREDEAVRAIVFDRRFAQAAAEMLDVPSVRLYHDQALFKPSGAGRTPWHRDGYYWPLESGKTVTMWLPLVDVDEAMGPMVFASGSHRSGNLGDLAISDETDRRLRDVIEERGWPVAICPLRAGDATFHSGATLHSAGANASARVREVLTVIYFAAGSRVTDPANDNQRVDLAAFFPGLAPGDEAASELNPVLYP